ncbi:hypothetical protein IOCL1545_000736200, partial [Leishmania shawi]
GSALGSRCFLIAVDLLGVVLNNTPGLHHAFFADGVTLLTSTPPKGAT